MDSILTSIKKLLGIAEEYEHFDPDIVMYINSAFSVLTQLGVGLKKDSVSKMQVRPGLNSCTMILVLNLLKPLST